jgi:hypothetical protein
MCFGGDDVGLGRWRCYGLLSCFPLTGLASFSKERGLGRRGVSTSTPSSTLYYRARARPSIGQMCSVYFRLAIKPHCALICRPSEPSYTHTVLRNTRCQSSHLHRAVPFSVTRSSVMHDCTAEWQRPSRAARRKAKVRSFTAVARHLAWMMRVR